jgi:hypothetical protein
MAFNPSTSYGSFMQPSSPVGEDNRRKMSSYGSVFNNQFNNPNQEQFSFAPSQMASSPPRNAASLSNIQNPSMALRMFGMGTNPPLPVGKDFFKKYIKPY